MPGTTEAAEVTAFDVSVELIAHKMALLYLLQAFTDTADGEPEGFWDWVYESPYPLPRYRPDKSEPDEPAIGRIIERAYELEAQWLRAVSAWTGRVADRADAYREAGAS